MTDSFPLVAPFSFVRQIRRAILFGATLAGFKTNFKPKPLELGRLTLKRCEHRVLPCRLLKGGIGFPTAIEVRAALAAISMTDEQIAMLNAHMWAAALISR